MAISLYMDVHIQRAITEGLRLRGVNILTAQEDGANQLPDPDLLDRTTGLQRALFTYDDDLIIEAARRQREDVPFAGVIYARQLRISIGTCVRDLEVIALAGEPADMVDTVIFLPL